MAVLAVPLVALVAAGTASADTLHNDLSTPGSATTVVGQPITVGFQIVAVNGDGREGCNAADGTAATIANAVPPAVTRDRPSRVVNACNTWAYFTFASTTPGDYNIRIIINDVGAGTYDVSGAAFTLHVVPAPPADTEPPVLSLPGNILAEQPGDPTTDVYYTVTANDAVDGSVPATCTPPSGYEFPIGTTTVNCSATDAAGNTATGSFTVTVRAPANACSTGNAARDALCRQRQNYQTFVDNFRQRVEDFRNR